MMKSHRLAIPAVAAALALALAGCTGDGGSGNESADEANPTIRIIGIGVPDFTAVDVQKWQENLIADGFRVDFKTVEKEDAALRAVVAGAADMYIGSLPSMITAIENAAAEVELIAVNAQSTSYVVLSDLSIDTIDDLAGATIGVNTPGSAGDTIMKLALEAEGFDTTLPEYVVIGGSSARVAALQAGQVQATVAHIGLAESAIATGDFKALLYAGPALGAYIQTGLIASTAYTEGKPDATQRVVDALIEAQRWAVSDKEGYLALSYTIDSETDDVVRNNTYDALLAQDFWATNGGLDAEAVDNWVSISLAAGDISSSSPGKSEWLNDRFVVKYLEKNGRN